MSASGIIVLVLVVATIGGILKLAQRRYDRQQAEQEAEKARRKAEQQAEQARQKAEAEERERQHDLELANPNGPPGPINAGDHARLADLADKFLADLPKGRAPANLRELWTEQLPLAEEYGWEAREATRRDAAFRAIPIAEGYDSYAPVPGAEEGSLEEKEVHSERESSLDDAIGEYAGEYENWD